MREENFLGLRADLQVGGQGFGKFSQVFQNFFWNFLRFFWNFLRFFWNFLRFFWKIFPKIFAIFFEFYDFPTIFFYDFSENSCPQSVTVQPGSRHYCKFTSKFIIRFTLILIKILQSTKFEGSHFFNSLPTFTTSLNLFQLLSHFRNLLRPPKAFPFAAVFSQPQLRRAKGTNGRPSPCDDGGMWAIRGIISRITSLIVSRLTTQRPGRKPTKNREKTKAPSPMPLSRSPSPSGKSF